MMQQSWFEMADLRRRRFETAAWIPLRAAHLKRAGCCGRLGYQEQFFGAASLAVPVAKRSLAEALGWNEIGILHSHSPYVDGRRYVPVDVSRHSNGLVGVRLVLEQRGNREEAVQWHVHPNLVIALALKREGNVWLSIDEGYEPVIRLHEDTRGMPFLLEIRAEHLKDYLCARRMALYLNSFRSRVEVAESVDHISWPSGRAAEDIGLDHWKGRVAKIHEGGMPFGATTAVFHIARTDVDAEEDVPILGPPGEANTRGSSWERTDEGRRLFDIRGEFNRSEWIEAGTHSNRVREDRTEAAVMFITDAAGKQESGNVLKGHGRWLWFRPQVMPALTNRRGGGLAWYTRDTGAVHCSPDFNVHFGINRNGLITVYAKDIGSLPEWQQRIWAGFNITPDGGVSSELLASQVEATPAGTQAPEAYLGDALNAIDTVGKQKLGSPILRKSEQHRELLRKANRFRGLDDPGLFSLAKDLARLTADSIDASALQLLAVPPKGEKWGSLKSLQHVVARKLSEGEAYSLLSPLFAIYELRLADAHLAGHEIEAAFKQLRVDRTVPHVFQALQMLGACVSALFTIADTLEQLPDNRDDATAKTS